MEFKNKLTDCVINDFMITIKTLYDYYEDAYYDGAEGIYCVLSEDDFKYLWDLYGLENAVKLYNENKDGNVIAGHNVKFDSIIKINKDNHADILASFAGMIEDRIALHLDAGNDIDFVKKIYPTINVSKLVKGNKYEVEITTTIWRNGEKTIVKDKMKDQYIGLNECRRAIRKDIDEELDCYEDFNELQYEINRKGNTTTFSNYTHDQVVVYEIKVVD